MSGSQEQLARVSALVRARGASTEARKAMAAQWEEQADWYAHCRRCGADLRGTPKALRAHACGEVADAPAR